VTTFVQLRTICAQRFTDPSNAVIADTTGSIRNWKDYVNAAYREVLRFTPLWPWNESSEQLVTVLANTRGVALPADVLAINWCYDVTNDRYIPGDQGRGSQWRGQRQLRSTTSEIADTYKLRSNNIELYPEVTVATQLALECVLAPVALNADSDVPVFPTVYHDILVEGALALAYVDDGSAAEYNLYRAQFLANEKQMMIDLLTVRDITYPPIRDAWYG
jgi:hypothetical protein